MKEINELLINVPQRGIKMLIPPGLEWLLENSRNSQQVRPLTENEKAKLWLSLYSSTLRKRYPNKDAGKEFMSSVDYQRRQELYLLAEQMTECIVFEWKKINSQREIAVVIFGSIVRGLVKCPAHPDPSNIDMAVIGDISDCERSMLLDSIRPTRERVKNVVLSGCSNLIESLDQFKGGNAGVIVQNIQKLTVNSYSQTIEYIRANATPTYDPEGIWGKVENDALNFVVNKGFLNKIRRMRRQGIVDTF